MQMSRFMSAASATVLLMAATACGGSALTDSPGGGDDSNNQASAFSYSIVNPPGWKTGDNGIAFKRTNDGVYLEHDAQVSKWQFDAGRWTYSEPAPDGLLDYAPSTHFDSGYDFEFLQANANVWEVHFFSAPGVGPGLVSDLYCACNKIARDESPSANVWLASGEQLWLYDFNRNNHYPWHQLTSADLNGGPIPASTGDGIATIQGAKNDGVLLVGGLYAFYMVTPLGARAWDLSGIDDGVSARTEQIYDDGRYVWVLYGSHLLRYEWSTDEWHVIADVAEGVGLGYGIMRMSVTDQYVYTNFGKVFDKTTGALVGSWLPDPPDVSKGDVAAITAYNTLAYSALDFAISEHGSVALVLGNDVYVVPLPGIRAPWTDPGF